MVERVAQAIQIPFTVGGGLATVDDAGWALEAGADKVSLNSAALARPSLIDEASRRVGSQSVVVAIDVKKKQWKLDGLDESRNRIDRQRCAALGRRSSAARRR